MEVHANLACNKDLTSLMMLKLNWDMILGYRVGFLILSFLEFVWAS